MKLNGGSFGNSSLGSQNFSFVNNLNSDLVNPNPLLWLGFRHCALHPPENIKIVNGIYILVFLVLPEIKHVHLISKTTS